MKTIIAYIIYSSWKCKTTFTVNILWLNPFHIHTLFIRSLIHSCIHSFRYSFLYSLIQSFVHFCIHAFIHNSFIRSCIHLFIYSIISLCHLASSDDPLISKASMTEVIFIEIVHSVIHSFVYAFIGVCRSPIFLTSSKRMFLIAN